MKKQINLSAILPILLFILLSSALLLPTLPARANAPSPPTVVWLLFEYQTAQTPRLEGVQLVGCDSAACANPVLLQQYGRCDGDGCLPGTAVLTGYENSIECTNEFCRAEAWPDHGGTDFRIVAQFSDRVRLSGVSGKLPADEDESLTWRVTVQESDLSIAGRGTPPAIHDPGKRLQANLGVVGLSILAELVVAGACFYIFARTDLRRWLGRLLMVLLVNLLSLPVVWLFFPSLAQLQRFASRNEGLFVLLAAGIYTGLLIAIYRAEGKARRRPILLAIGFIPLTFLCYLATAMLQWMDYGNTFYVQGLSATLLIVLAEVFAVVFEAVVLMLLSKRALPAGLIWVTSLLMNAASFGIGWLSNVSW